MRWGSGTDFVLWGNSGSGRRPCPVSSAGFVSHPFFQHDARNSRRKSRFFY